MRTGSDYLGSLRDGRTVMLDGERIDDVAAHPAFTGVAHTMAEMYDLAADPAQRDVYTYPSPRDGAPVHAWWNIPRTRDDLAHRRRAIEAWSQHTYGFLGRSPDHVASFLAGFAALMSSRNAGDGFTFPLSMLLPPLAVVSLRYVRRAAIPVAVLVAAIGVVNLVSTANLSESLSKQRLVEFPPFGEVPWANGEPHAVGAIRAQVPGPRDEFTEAERGWQVIDEELADDFTSPIGPEGQVPWLSARTP